MNLSAKSLAYAALASTVALAGCVSSGPAPQPMRSSSGIEGQWMDTQGVSISSFTGGIFQTIATDTGNKLSEGTYTFRDANTIEISMTSLIRQTQTTVACARVSPVQLNCTNAEGQNFILTRRS